MKIAIRFAPTIVFWSLLVAACGAAADSNKAIAGTYALAVTDQQILDAGGDFRVANLAAGSWQLEFTAAGVSKLYRVNEIGPSFVEEEWPYRISGGEITFETPDGGLYCPPNDAQGTYHWKVDGSALQLTAVQDPCARKYLLSAGTWTKLP